MTTLVSYPIIDLLKRQNLTQVIIMARRKTTAEFIDQARKIHGDKYDYSLVEYKKAHDLVKIICPEHGRFEQRAYSHLHGFGCAKCGGRFKSDTKYFIQKARKVHGDKYDYSLVEYSGNKKKVKIICSEHDVFEQSPNSHLRGHGCHVCSGKLHNKKSFIDQARKIHGDKYDYSKISDFNTKNTGTFICPTHGLFKQRLSSHLEGYGCAMCSGFMLRDTQSFIDQARKTHGDKYDYSQVEYTKATEKVKILCPDHGRFWQSPANHCNGSGCGLCGYKSIKDSKLKTTSEFIGQARKIHGNKYDYSQVEYTHSTDKVNIICPDHGWFWQRASDHLRGCGCPKCQHRQSKLEKRLINVLREHTIVKESIKMDDGKEIDIYLPEFAIGIELNGVRWHSRKPKDYHINKTKQAKAQGIRLIHIPIEANTDNEKIERFILSLIKPREKIYGRKCTIKELSFKDTIDFLNTNHVQGVCAGSLYLGLFNENSLVGVATFKRDQHGVQLSRYATTHAILGGLAKVTKYALSKFQVRTIHTFCDDSMFTGTSYIKNGYVKAAKIPPDYKYERSGRLFHKFSKRRRSLIKEGGDASLPESKMAEQLGYMRYYDCGKTRYEFVLDTSCQLSYYSFTETRNEK